jgi:hypothetical protein
MFITGVVYAYSLNSIGNIISNINKNKQEFREDMQIIHNLMRKEDIE